MAKDRIGTQFFRRSLIDDDGGTAEKTPPKEHATAPINRRRRSISSTDIRAGTGQDIDPVIGRLILSCWRSFFEMFRPDEQPIEFARYREEADAVIAAVDQLGSDGLPDLVTCKQILFLLSRFTRERFHEYNDRVEDLAQQSRELAQQLEAHRLTSSVSVDELARVQDVLEASSDRLALSAEQNAVEAIEEVVDGADRDRKVLQQLANHLDPDTLATLPLEVQLHLNCFRE